MKKICENRFQDFIPFNKENKNNRIYTKESFIPERFEEFQKKVNDRRVLGEFFDGPYSFEDPTVNLKNTIHFVTFIEMNNDRLFVKIELIDNPNLEPVINEMRKYPENYVIRPRAAGKIDENKNVKDVKIITFDIIPAHIDSFQNVI